MGKELFDSSKLAQEYFERADDLLGFSITEVMFEGTAKELKQTKYSQPAIFLHSYILAKILGKDFKPDMVAGHSLGEISALAAVGTLGFEPALNLISRRASLMQKVCDADNTGMAVVVGLYDVIVRDVCRQVEGVVVPANYNSLHQVVISGEVTALQRAIEKLSPAASRVIKLPVSGAFHSPFMEPIVEDYLAAVEDVEFHKPFCPVYQNVNGRPTQQVELIKKNLILQLTHPVMWRHTILHMLEDGATDFKEIGPGKLLTGLVTQIEKTWAPMPFRK